MNNQLGMPQVAPNVFVKGGRFPSGGETYACPMNAGMAAFPAPLLDLPLTTSIVPRNSSAVPTFNRASVATFEDWEGKVRTALSGEARFQGARRVRNHLNVSEALPTPNGGGVASIATVAAGFTAPDGTPSAFRVTTNLNGGVAGADTSYVDFDVGGPKDFSVPVHSVWLKNNGGGNSVLLRQSSATLGYVVLIDNTWRRYTVTSAAVLGIVGGMFTLGQRGNINPGVALDFLFWHPQLEEAVGQSNTAPAEYVSKGVLATPYHGANVDGVKYFDVTNPNTVTGNVVTVSTAAPIAIAGCQYWAESAKINICLQSNAFLTAPWAPGGGGTTAPVQDTVGPDGAVSAWTLTDADAVAFRSQAQNIAIPNDNQTYVISIFVKKTAGGTSPVFAVNTAMAGGVAVNTNARWDTDTGLSGTAVGIVPLSQSVGNYWRFFLVTTNNASGNVTLNIAVFPASAAHTASPTSASDNAAATGTAVVFGCMVEAGIFASKYIDTAAATVTRLIDGLSYPNAGSMNATQGTCYAEAQTEWSVNEASVWLVGTDGSGRLLFISGPGSNPTGISSKDAGVGSATGGGASMFGVTKRCGSSWSGTVSKSYYEGLAVSTGVNTGAMSLLTNIGIGCQGGGGSNGWSGGIKNVKIWDRALTDTQINAMVGSI